LGHFQPCWGGGNPEIPQNQSETEISNPAKKNPGLLAGMHINQLGKSIK